MKWFGKLLIKSIKAAQKDEAILGSIPEPYSKQAIVSSSSDLRMESDKAVQFRVFMAQGGRVVETQRYDRQRDRHNTGLYVIHNDQEFGKEIDKILTMESLK
jgi:hypothetical protein